MTRHHEVDPITVEVIRTYYQSTARQMRNVLVRASFNPIIYEMIDFSLGLYNRDAELIAEGPGIPIFMGALTFAIRDIVKYVGEENLEDGDVLLSTYPYWTGSHSQDAVTVRPIFIDGKIYGYTAAKAHWADLGAVDVYAVDTKDIWQEGLQIYGAKIVKKGKIDHELLEIVRANTRLPDAMIGDLTGQISACNRGAIRVMELVQKYGAETVNGAVKQILSHGEEVARKAIAAMPNGEWQAEAFMDNNGVEDHPIRVAVRVKIDGDRIHVDTTGTSGQQKGPINCPLATTISFIRLVVKMVVAPSYEANEGFFRPLSVTVPEGSLLNPVAPAPVFLYGWSGFPLGDAMFKVFSQTVPERSVARSGGDIGGLLFSGFDPVDGAYYAGGWDECVGQGASMDADGENALIHYSLGESSNVPVEIIEERYPILVDCYELWENSGGAGQHRGGLGVRKHWTALAPINLITTIEATNYPAWGIDGGKGSVANEVILKAETPNARRVGKSKSLVGAGEKVHLHMGGGGGWGNPLLRDPEAVLRDVRLSYVSTDKARDDYGVVIIEREQDVLALDAIATRHLREERRKAS